jgi:hypothetical protein
MAFFTPKERMEDADQAAIQAALDRESAEMALLSITRIGRWQVRCTPERAIECRFGVTSGFDGAVVFILMLLVAGMVALVSLAALAVIVAAIALPRYLDRKHKPLVHWLYPEAGYMITQGGREPDVRTELGLPLQFSMVEPAASSWGREPILDFRVAGPVGSALIAAGSRGDLKKLEREYASRLKGLEEQARPAPDGLL